MRKLTKLAVLGLSLGMSLSLTGCTERTVTNDINASVKEESPVLKDESDRKSKDEYVNEKLNPSDYVISNTFDLNLYKQLLTNNQSFCVSPYSIKDCFSIIYPGVSGDTRDEIDTVLNFDERSHVFYENYDSEFLDEHLLVANKGFINVEREREVDLDSLNVDSLEFVTMDSEGVESINSFVSESTKKYIDNLVSEKDVNENTLAVLVNALYFNNEWKSAYERAKVSFNGETVDGFSGELAVKDVKELTDKVDLMRLQYKTDSPSENQYSLYVFDSVDGDKTSVDEYLTKIDDSKFENALDFSDYNGLTTYDEVKFLMPEYEVEFKSELTDVLKNMGLVAPFNNADDFSEIGDMVIGKVIHGTYMKVDYLGTEAAASTAMAMEDGVALVTQEKKVKEITVDSDFTYVLKDDTNNVILFIGRYTK